jgi:glycosyltransferase involved in cell wall biosynthesis
MKTFSIVIPAYNQLPLLQQAIDSVLQQEWTDYEIIVTDDSTNDDIQQYINRLGDDRIRYFRHQPQQSAADNWNNGLQQTTGQYLILMHHDERMKSPAYLQHLSWKMPQYDVVVSRVEVTINDQLQQRRFPKWVCSCFVQHPAFLFFMNTIGPCACITFRRELLQPFNTRLRWMVDTEWYYRMLKGRHCLYDSRICIQSVHGHEGQITQTLQLREAFLQDKVVLRQTYKSHVTVKLMLWLYQNLILRTKKILGKI